MVKYGVVLVYLELNIVAPERLAKVFPGISPCVGKIILSHSQAFISYVGYIKIVYIVLGFY